MLKEKYQIAKNFVKEHKKEILIGAGIVVGTIAAIYLGKKLSGTIGTKLSEMKQLPNDGEDAYITAYNKAATIANETLIPEINAKYEQYDFSDIENNPAMKAIYEQYEKEYDDRFNELLKSLL